MGKESRRQRQGAERESINKIIWAFDFSGASESSKACNSISASPELGSRLAFAASMLALTANAEPTRVPASQAPAFQRASTSSTEHHQPAADASRLPFWRFCSSFGCWGRSAATVELSSPSVYRRWLADAPAFLTDPLCRSTFPAAGALCATDRPAYQ